MNKTRITTLFFLFALTPWCQAQDSEQDSLPEPAVEIRGGEKTESIRLPNGDRHVKITPANGEPYCLQIREPDPFDELAVGSSARVRCRW